MTKILLADDHPVIRTGLKIFIEKAITSSAIDEVWDAGTAYQKIEENDYAMLILDATIAGVESFTLVHDALAIKPESKILMFSVNNEELYAKKYLQLGAKGYLSKDASEVEIESAIYNVLSNKKYISASLLESLTDNLLKDRPDNPFDLLSAREFEIVQHLIRGATVGELSSKLNIHTSTVGTLKARIFTKLKCKNIVDINALAKLYNINPSF